MSKNARTVFTERQNAEIINTDCIDSYSKCLNQRIVKISGQSSRHIAMKAGELRRRLKNDFVFQIFKLYIIIEQEKR